MNSYFYIFISILLTTAAQLIIKWKMAAYSLEGMASILEKFQFAFKMLFDPFIIIALVFTFVSGLAWMIALVNLELSYVFPFTALGFVLILIFSALIFNESITWYNMAGMGLIITGIFLNGQS